MQLLPDDLGSSYADVVLHWLSTNMSPYFLFAHCLLLSLLDGELCDRRGWPPFSGHSNDHLDKGRLIEGVYFGWVGKNGMSRHS